MQTSHKSLPYQETQNTHHDPSCWNRFLWETLPKSNVISLQTWRWYYIGEIYIGVKLIMNWV